MIRIVASSNTRAVDALLSAARIRDRATDTASRRHRRARAPGRTVIARSAPTPGSSTTCQEPIEVPRSEWESAARGVPAAVRRAIRDAAASIRRVSKAQVPKGFRVIVRPGVTVEQRVVPLARVGCYVPAGRYPLPSSLLMTAIPARRRWRAEVIVACPRPDATVFAAAVEAGVDRLFRMGGAHAVAAMAYGTRTVPRVDKIVGPGNRWVSAAKSMVTADCAIDFYAGPPRFWSWRARPARLGGGGPHRAGRTRSGCPGCVHHDQRPPGPGDRHRSRAADSEGRTCRASLWKHGGIIVAASMNEAVSLANACASEHLVVESDEMLRGHNAGASSLASGPRRWPATTPSVRTTCCPPRARRAIAAA